MGAVEGKGLGMRGKLPGFMLVDAAFMGDPKFTRLARLASGPVTYMSAVGLFFTILADCRRSRSPTVQWADYDDWPDEAELLRRARLLLPEGFDPVTFDYYAPRRPDGSARSAPDRPGSPRFAPKPSLTVPSPKGEPTFTKEPVDESPRTAPDNPVSFMGWKARTVPVERLPGEAIIPRHEGQHPDCLVCGTVKKKEKP